MAALAALARGFGKILGLLAGWLEGLCAPRRRALRVRPIAGASDGTEEASSNGAARPPNRRRGIGRATASNGHAGQTVARRSDAGTRPRRGRADRAALTSAEGATDANGAAGAVVAVEPEVDEATVEELREGARRSLVPRWLAERRTSIFNTLAVLGMLVFGGLTVLVDAGATAGADLAATTALQTAQHPVIGGMMQLVSSLGFPPTSLLTIGSGIGLLVLAGLRPEAAFLGLAGASSILTLSIKTLVGRPRPDADLVAVTSTLTDPSFPSGHVLMYVTFFGFLGYLAYALLKPGRLRTAALWSCGVLILLVGPSRIWLGHHWMSDVLASYALGLAYLVVLVQAYGRYRLRPV